jgi:hypothetical protein
LRGSELGGKIGIDFKDLPHGIRYGKAVEEKEIGKRLSSLCIIIDHICIVIFIKFYL